jgi:hypothetical protein
MFFSFEQRVDPIETLLPEDTIGVKPFMRLAKRRGI